MEHKNIIVFDGVCIFCNGAVDFIINRDPEAKFSFTPMQSALAKDLMRKYQISNVGVDTFLLVKGDSCFVFSDAALEIAKDLSGYWFIFNIIKIIPKALRDFFYRLFARNRYALFGRTEQCMIPNDKVKSRFVGV